MNDLLGRIHTARSVSLAQGDRGCISLDLELSGQHVPTVERWTPHPGAIPLSLWRAWARPLGHGAVRVTVLDWTPGGEPLLASGVVPDATEADLGEITGRSAFPYDVETERTDRDHPALLYRAEFLAKQESLDRHRRKFESSDRLPRLRLEFDRNGNVYAAVEVDHYAKLDEINQIAAMVTSLPDARVRVITDPKLGERAQARAAAMTKLGISTRYVDCSPF